MVDVYDDTVAEQPEGDVLTLESLNATMERLRGMGCVEPGAMASWSGPWHSRDPLFGLRTVVVSDAYLPAERPRKLTRWERFRVWVEDLADRADCYYHYPRVKRTEPAPAGYLFGRNLLVVRSDAAVAIRNNYTT